MTWLAVTEGGDGSRRVSMSKYSAVSRPLSGGAGRIWTSPVTCTSGPSAFS